MNYKNLKYIGYALFLFIVGVSIYSCTEDLVDMDILSEKDGPARVDYIRITDPNAADSLLTGAFLGNLIAIIGDNLGNTKELWFNDQKALLNPAYVTDKSVIVNVPTAVPTMITNEIKFVFSDGSELTHPFSINVPSPKIDGIKSEFVPDGGVAEIYGDFFFEPMTVTFPGGKEGVVTSIEKNKIQVIVPEGSEPGNIEISTNFGKAKSAFLFRDNRNIILDYDTKIHETWTAKIGYDDVAGITPVDGNFAYFQSGDHGAWAWVNEMTMQYWAPNGRGNIPLANGLTDNLDFRFEVNVPIPWQDVRMEMFFGPYIPNHGRDEGDVAIYRWAPFENGPYTTDGWQTISIPLSAFNHNTGNDDEDRKIADISALTNITMMVFGPAENSTPILIAIDNLRIVPNN
ncbi:glycan-binding surface protein [Portibacter lacus]|uniref:Surface glycan-binding protein B xyloglucan binding domain-containing protein n=1 Tax=Portibacter lacus TaxID=1099794 RepID=A0AA37SMX0_9BACT|nr:glycan-binding surface protein [Portibacter lacus]GLR17281.1 hypothetical protein GCM10007940_18960 [Portibacter lacus]